MKVPSRLAVVAFSLMAAALWFLFQVTRRWVDKLANEEQAKLAEDAAGQLDETGE